MSEPAQWQRNGTRESRSFGELLREWRVRRRYSQLALALEAGTSSRHLSFLETGRAKPSREMLHRLAERLEVPLRQRNALLVAAGFAPAYRERPLDDAALAAVQEAVTQVLSSLEPCPALIIDRHWNLVAGNRMLRVLLAGVEPGLLEPPVNALRVGLHPGGLARRIENLGEWRAHLLGRLRREAELTADPALVALLEELRAYPEPAATPAAAPAAARPDAASGPPVAVPLQLRTEHGLLSFISTTTVFGTAVDVSLSEITIEAFLPADQATRRALQSQMAAG